jgi:hypothetical protein
LNVILRETLDGRKVLSLQRPGVGRKRVDPFFRGAGVPQFGAAAKEGYDLNGCGVLGVAILCASLLVVNCGVAVGEETS